jgi:small conductance mechanosensitive channel
MDENLLENLKGLVEVVSTWGLRVVGGVAILIIGLMVARIGRSATIRTLRGSSLDESLVGFLGSLVYYAIASLVVISFFGIVGIETASLITVLGASSLAIGLALQGSLANFASGVMLLVFRPYRPGDYIEVGDDEGWVAELGVFSTAIDTLDHSRIVLPNAHVAERPIKNWSTHESRRLDLSIEVDIGCDLPATRAAIAAVLASDPRILDDPPPTVAVSDFGDTSAELVVRPWCRMSDYWALRYDLPERLKDAVEGAGGAMPTPQRSLRLERVAEA